MRRFSITATIFTIISLTDSIDAFTPVASWRLSSRLHSTEDGDRIKKAGQGITTQTPGDLCFYDPNENGRLQGSNTLTERLEKGSLFTASGAEETQPPTNQATNPNPKTHATIQPKVELNRSTAETPLSGDLTERLEKGALFLASGKDEPPPINQATEPDPHTHANIQPKMEFNRLAVKAPLSQNTQTHTSTQIMVKSNGSTAETALTRDTDTNPHNQPKAKEEFNGSTANLSTLIHGQSGASDGSHGQERSSTANLTKLINGRSGVYDRFPGQGRSQC